jgi:hypothetical protein
VGEERAKKNLPPCSYCMGEGKVEYILGVPARDELIVEIRFKDGVIDRYSGPQDLMCQENLVAKRPDRNEDVIVERAGMEYCDAGLVVVFKEKRFDLAPRADHRSHLRVCRDGNNE